MRRNLLLPALAGVTVVAGWVPPPAAGQAAATRPTCVTSVVAVDAAGHVRVDEVRNDRVVASRRSPEALPSVVTAWGFYDAQDSQDGATLRLDAVTADGTPRRVTLGLDGARIEVESSRYDQGGFTPRLFADGYGSYAYTVNGTGKLQRWALTRFRNGDLRFADKITIGSGYADLTSLQSSMRFTRKGVEREYLYATTSGGALQQIAVPVERPRKETVRTLRSSGYEGVTELSWSTCNDKDDYASLIAISPTANTATWTTVRSSVTRPRARLRGPVTGGTDWNLSAAY